MSAVAVFIALGGTAVAVGGLSSSGVLADLGSGGGSDAFGIALFC